MKCEEGGGLRCYRGEPNMKEGGGLMGKIKRVWHQRNGLSTFITIFISSRSNQYGVVVSSSQVVVSSSQ